MPAFIQYLVMSSLACLAMIYMPSFIFILALIWGTILIMAGLNTNKGQMIIIIAVNLLLVWVISGNALQIYVGLPAAAMAIGAATKRGYYDLLKMGLVTAVVACIFLASLFYLNGDSGLKQLEPQIDHYVQESIELYEDTGIFERYAEQGLNRSEFESSMYKAVHVMVQHLPALYFLQAVVIMLLSLYLAFRLARNRGINQLQKRPFRCEQMPWQAAWLVIAGLGFWLAGSSGSILRLIGSNLLTIMTPILAYFGLSVLAYKLNQVNYPRKRWLIALIIIIAAIFTLPAVIFLTLVGLFDALIDYRKLRIDKEVPL